MRFNSLQKLAHAFMSSQTFLTAVELNIFEKIGKKAQRPTDISKKIRCSLRGTEMLLNALTGLKLLKKTEDGKFKNSPIAMRYLVPDSKHFIGDAFRHSYIQYQHWTHLSECIMTGKPLKTRRDYNRFLSGMHYHGKQKAEFIASKVTLPENAKSMLDIGAGPGTYSIEFLKKYRKLNSTILDYTPAIQWAKKLGKKENVLNRMKFINGDFFKANFGEKYDIVLLSNIIHIYSERENIALLKKIKNCIKSGGKLIIHDIFLNKNGYKPLNAALFSLNMLIHTEKGRSYTKEEIFSWLKETGFCKMKTITIPGGSTIIICSIK